MKSAFLISFLDILSLAILIPVAPIQLLQLGGSRFQIGLLVSLNALLQLLIGPLVGSLSETKGRKPILLRIGVLSLISNALLFVPGSLNVYIASRLLSSLFGHTQLLVKGIIGENVPLEKHREVFTKLGGLVGLSFILGPLLGGYLHSLPGGFSYIAITLTSINALNLALSATLPTGKLKVQEDSSNIKSKKKKQPKKTPPAKQENSIQLFRAFANLKNANWSLYWDVLTFKFLNETSNTVFNCALGIMVMLEFRSSQQQLSYVISFLSFMMIVGNIASGKIKAAFYSKDTSGFKRTTQAFVILTLLFTLLYLKATFWTYIAFIVPFAVFRTILDSTWMEMLVVRSSPADRAKIMGISDSMIHMAALLTPMVTGHVGDTYGYRTTFLLSIVPLFIGSVIGVLRLMTSTAKIAKGKKKD